MENVDIAIVGGGMVGLSLAAALESSGLTVAVISDQPFSSPLPDDPLLRVSAINGANREMLLAMGVWSRLPEDRVCAYNTMEVRDKDSFGRIHFSCDMLPAPQLGHIVENQALVNALTDKVSSQNNVLMAQSRISKILWGQRETMIMLKNDEVIACRLLVGADGANSFIRNQVKLPLSFKDYGHTAIVATVRTQKSHNHCARQVFTPDGPLALLPLADPHLCSIVWSQNTEVANQLVAIDDIDFSHQLTATTNSELGSIRLQSERQAFPLTMRYARKWVKEGVVIIGDAAHTIHPLAGQGVNLGMQDAFALANALTGSVGEDVANSRVLRAFERARKAEAATMIAAMEGFKVLFSGNHPLKKWLRGVGLSATDSIPPIKRQWLIQAMGW